MVKFFKRIKKKSILEKITSGNLETFFRPYYINDEKINNLFVQEYGAIEEFTKSCGNESSLEMVLGIKNKGLTKLLAELSAELKLGGKKSAGRTETFRIPTILRFIFLRKYLEDKKRLVNLENADFESLARHTLISYVGEYRFAEQAEDPTFPLTRPQVLEVERRKKFEEKTEGNHYLYLIKTPKRAISIISSRFTLHTGRRYLMHPSGADNRTLFIGFVIGLHKDILFLDPIGIGEEVSKEA